MTPHPPAHLTVRLDDDATTIRQEDGSEHVLPVGPRQLARTVLAGGDPPPPEDLTNALGLVADHFDDAIIEAPTLAAPDGITITGDHAASLARVERGSDDVAAYTALSRAEIDDVFRALATESTNDRRFNPGLDPGHVESIVGTCCVVLAILRRLDATEITVAVEPGATA